MPIVHLLLHVFRQLTHSGKLVQHAGDATHVGHLRQLFAKILQVETTFLHLAGKLFGFFVVDLALGFLDQREDIAHAKNPGGNPLRVKRLQRINLLAHPDELDGFAGNGAY